MWTAGRTRIAAGETISLWEAGRALAVRDAIALWRRDEAFRNFLIAALAASPYKAFFWEMPPLAHATLADPFECALIRGDALARIHADDSDFAEHFIGTEQLAVFPNLGGDALLIAPRNIAGAQCYGHLAAFLRHGPREQQHALLRTLAGEIEKRLA